MQIATSTDSATKPAAGKANSKGKRASAAKETLHLKAKQADAENSTSTESASGDAAMKIAIAAYYRAERRGFEPGHELEDWLTAEREVLSLHS